MQNDNQQKPDLDDDILQCKADLQNALRAVLRDAAEGVSSSGPQAVKPAQSSKPRQTEKSDSPRPESNSPAGIRILPFEAMQTTKTPPADSAAPPPESPVLPEDAETDEEIAEPSANAAQDAAVRQIEELTEKNERLAMHLEASTLSADLRRQQIEQLERALAEKIGEIAALRQQADETAAAIIEQLERTLAEKIGEIATLQQQADESAEAMADIAAKLRLTAEEKDAARERYEAQALEWAKTLEALKAAQATAAETLVHRQEQLEAIREELSHAEHRLELADAANVTLSRENAELTEALRDTRSLKNRYEQEALLGFGADADESESFETEESPSEPEPYCEPVADVISEDDVHLEQKLADAAIPTFNLAEQIMAEQRKASAARRQGPAAARQTTPSDAVEQVVRQYVASVPPPAPPVPPAPTIDVVPAPTPADRAERFLRWQGEPLSGYQQSLLGSIIQKDIRRFCGMDVPLRSLHQSMAN